MKNFKIITLLILMLGFITSYAQQTTTGSQKSDTGPATELLNPAQCPANQIPANIPREGPSSTLTGSQNTESQAMTNKSPGERDPSMVPLDQQGGNSNNKTNSASPARENTVYTGPTPADVPGAVKPDKK